MNAKRILSIFLARALRRIVAHAPEFRRDLGNRTYHKETPLIIAKERVIIQTQPQGATGADKTGK
ncbi:hypothetical protein D3C78_1567610 [compost metagenome]